MVQLIWRVFISQVRQREVFISNEACILCGEQEEQVDAIGDLTEEGVEKGLQEILLHP